METEALSAPTQIRRASHTDHVDSTADGGVASDGVTRDAGGAEAESTYVLLGSVTLSIMGPVDLCC